MKDRYIDTLKEKIYTATKEDGKETNFEQVSSFLEEVAMRKRFDAVEGGLQAAVILPNQFAAKINEEDGYDPHMNSKVNLIKYMNGGTIFLSHSGTKFPALSI